MSTHVHTDTQTHFIHLFFYKTHKILRDILYAHQCFRLLVLSLSAQVREAKNTIKYFYDSETRNNSHQNYWNSNEHFILIDLINYYFFSSFSLLFFLINLKVRERNVECLFIKIIKLIRFSGVTVPLLSKVIKR